MWRACSCLALLIAGVVSCGSTADADDHRVLVLDIGRYPNNRPGSDRHQLVMLDVESGKVVAHAELGLNTSLALSSDGETVAALTYLRGDAPGTRLKYYRTADLSLQQSGRFPDTVPRRGYQLGAAADIRLSPNGQELLLCGLEGTGNVDLATAVVTRVKKELDSDGYFKSEAAARIRPCRSVEFVNVSTWPRVYVLNNTFTLLQVLDLDSGKIQTSLPVGGAAIDAFDQPALESADFKSIIRVRNQGVLIPGGERYTYFLPRPVSDHPGLPRPLPEAGFLTKIDLSADPPKVIRTGQQREPDLRVGTAAVSESAATLFVLEERRNPQYTHEPSRWVKVFSTADLTFKRQIELPLTDCQDLEVSRDGKYLYALDADNAKLAVLETASGRALKVLDVGKYPLLMMALPERSE